MNRRALAIDVGGTKVAIGLVDATGAVHAQTTIPTHERESCEPRDGHDEPPATANRSRARVPVPADDPATRLLRRIAAAARQVLSETGATPVAAGVGTTGHVDARRGVILHSGLVPGWSGLALGPRLTELLGLPVRMLNDGHAMAVAEHRIGAARGCDHALCVAVGTGVGGGLIHDGRLYLGQRGLAGMLGHSTIAFNGRRCQCGKRGCLEAYAAGPRIVDEYHRLRRRLQAARRLRQVAGVDFASAGAGTGDLGVDHSSRVRTLQEVAQRAARGDALAIEALERGGTYLGAGLASLANALNPQIIVVGGGVLGAGEWWLAAVRRTVFERTRHTAAEGLEVVPAALGPGAVLVGAGLAALDAAQVEPLPEFGERRPPPGSKSGSPPPAR